MVVAGEEPPKEPPTELVQVPPVAPPPTEPPRPVVVPPWQISGVADPALAVGVAITVTVLLADTAEQGAMPVVVNVSVAVPL